MGGLPPVFVEFLGSSKGVKTAMADVKAELAVADESGAGAFKKTGMLGKAAIAGIGIAAVGAALATAHMAADFQTQMTRVRTGAGEAAANMTMVGNGVLAMAGQVGESTTELTSGLYTVESASFHGADALTVLKDSAMGAKVGAADLATVTDAVTTGLNAYHEGASKAADVTNALIGTEAEGKTNMEALAGSMASILPTASAAHVGLNEVLGAMATMTAQGTPAAVAATYLRQTIGMLSNPSAKAASEMKDLGLSSVQVAQNLGKNGLASTLNELTGAITKHMGPAGLVLIQHLQAAAKNTTAYQKVLADLPPAQQTYIGALATMVGGTKSMQAALELTGPHMKDFQANTAGIATHVKDAHGGIEGWADVQKTFNQRMAEAKAAAGAMGIQIGQYLLPVLTRAAGVIGDVTTWLTKHKSVAEAVAIVIGGALVFALAAVTAQLYAMAAAAAVNPITWIVLAVVAVIAALVMLILHWRQVWDFIKAAAKGIADAAVGAWNWISSNTARIWGDIVSWLTGAWNDIASFFSSAWHTATDPLVAGWHWLEAATTAVWDGITGFFRKWWPLLLVIFMPFIALIMAIWNHFHTQIIGTAMAVWNWIKGFFVGVWHNIQQDAAAGWALVHTYIITPVMQVWAELVHIWNTVSGWLNTQWNKIKAQAEFVWAHIKSAIIDPITQTWHKLVTLMLSIQTTIGTAIRNAWNTVTGWMSHWYDLGGNIISGIIKGIEDKAGQLFGTMKNIAEGALNSAKSFLGISSPSRRAADEIGQWIPHGAALGVTEHAHVAYEAVAAMSRRMIGQTSGFSFGAGGMPGALAAGAGSAGGSSAMAQVITIVQLDSEELFRAIQQRALLFDRRNPQAGLVYVRA